MFRTPSFLAFCGREFRDQRILRRHQQRGGPTARDRCTAPFLSPYRAPGTRDGTADGQGGTTLLYRSPRVRTPAASLSRQSYIGDVTGEGGPGPARTAKESLNKVSRQCTAWNNGPRGHKGGAGGRRAKQRGMQLSIKDKLSQPAMSPPTTWVRKSWRAGRAETGAVRGFPGGGVLQADQTGRKGLASRGFRFQSWGSGTLRGL